MKITNSGKKLAAFLIRGIKLGGRKRRRPQKGKHPKRPDGRRNFA